MEHDILPHASKLHALIAPREPLSRMATMLIAHLALAGPVLVLDAGNRYDGYGVARQVAAAGALNSPVDSIAGSDPAALNGSGAEVALKHVRVARSFTCYQIAARLAQQVAAPIPIIVLDLPSTFEDENVPYPERMRLLGACLQDLRRLATAAPVLVTASLHSAGLTAQAAALLQRIEEAADSLQRIEDLPPAVLQPSLFHNVSSSSPLPLDPVEREHLRSLSTTGEIGLAKKGELLVHTRLSPCLRRYIPNKS